MTSGSIRSVAIVLGVAAAAQNRMLAGCGNGPHPYEIGVEWVQRYFRVTENCARATELKVQQEATQAR
jgi:hypothetical protein